MMFSDKRSEMQEKIAILTLSQQKEINMLRSFSHQIY